MPSVLATAIAHKLRMKLKFPAVSVFHPESGAIPRYGNIIGGITGFLFPRPITDDISVRPMTADIIVIIIEKYLPVVPNCIRQLEFRVNNIFNAVKAL